MATYWSSPMFRQFKNIWWRLHHPNCQCNHKKSWETIPKWRLGKLQRGAVNLQMNLHHQSSYHCLNGGFHRFPKSWGYPQIINFYKVLHYKTSLWGNHFRTLPNPEFCMVNELQGRCLCRCRALGWGAGRLHWGLATGRWTLDGTVIWLESICNIL